MRGLGRSERLAYSYRSASIGSIRAARMAGTNELTRPTTIRIAVQIADQFHRQNQVDVDAAASHRPAVRRGSGRGLTSQTST